ncbi:methyltransferase domain-containing protein [Rhodospirillaceae bacterium KN72]|uniref:Methyltransferase domain-containing protein n=1 Tax=Pacificispira spongiicola TaxID=2729598 RepID=A0A7Y0E060_9PROT|nr:transcription antitermination factor NusB [Pacificispira spongiicola]NMM44807.1 methyltransferase domain-containing protein [Pacificispira spongiicola]
MSDGIDSRLAAMDLLESVLHRGLSFDDALAQSKPLQKLTQRDRGFARTIALTALRRMGQIDALLFDYLEHPPKGKAKRVLDVLRVGLTQLLFLNTPSHAALAATVDLAKSQNMRNMAGMVNAVLRRADRDGKATLAAQDAGRLNTPDWLWSDWEAQFGADTAAAIATAHLADAPIDVTVPIDRDLWAERLKSDPIGPQSVRLRESRDVTKLPGFLEGKWWVQDVAATLPALLLGDVSGKRVIDLCAAPGGKTLQLVAGGAEVTAVDRSKARLQRLQDNLKRLRYTANVVDADATQWRPDAPADAVLLDAPCSATGTLRRHPEIAYRRDAGDSSKLAALQKRLVEAAVEMLAPGGTLVVATCSLQSAEGAELLSFAKSLDGVSFDPVQATELPDLPGTIAENGTLRTLPSMLSDKGGMDGFFAARFKRED